MLDKKATPGLRLRALATIVQSTPELRDAYNALLTGIQLNIPLGSHPSILVTSTQPHEGKTTVASCLAIAAALSGQTVLLIDGDLRRPSLASAAGIANGIGFGEVIEGRADSDDAINCVDLFESTKGSRHAQCHDGRREVAGISCQRELGQGPHDDCGNRAAVRSVLINSPPILAANDALMLAGIVDGVLLVVGAGSADRDEVRRAKEQIEPVGTPLIGAVLNQFDPKLHGRPDRPYLGYYLDDRR